MPPDITCVVGLNSTLNVGGVKTLFYNISYDLGSLEKGKDYSSKQISKF